VGLLVCSQDFPHVNPIHTLPLYFFKVYYNIIFPSKSVSSKWSLSIRFPPPHSCIHLPTKHLPLEFLPKHTPVRILLWAPRFMGFCTFSCWNCLCSTLPLKEIPGRHYCMSCPSYTISDLLKFILSELSFHLRY